MLLTFPVDLHRPKILVIQFHKLNVWKVLVIQTSYVLLPLRYRIFKDLFLILAYKKKVSLGYRMIFSYWHKKNFLGQKCYSYSFHIFKVVSNWPQKKFLVFLQPQNEFCSQINIFRKSADFFARILFLFVCMI